VAAQSILIIERNPRSLHLYSFIDAARPGHGVPITHVITDPTKNKKGKRMVLGMYGYCSKQLRNRKIKVYQKEWVVCNAT
jgi:hypothetical protein